MSVSTRPRNYKYAVGWICLSPILFLMASISTVESLPTYYIQLAAFSLVSLIGLIVGVGYIVGSPWAPITAKYVLWMIGIYFIGSWLLIAGFLVWRGVIAI